MTDTAADLGPLRIFHLPSLVRAAESALADVMAVVGIREKADLLAFAQRWLLRPEYEKLQPMLRGLEAFVRRMLLLMALALPASAARAVRKATKPRAKPAGPPVQVFAFRIFPAKPRARGLRKRIRYEPAEKEPDELWIPPRLLRGSRPKPVRKSHPRLKQPGSAALRRDPPPIKPRIHIRPALGLAVRIEALRRAIVHAELRAQNLRRRLDARKRFWAGRNDAPPDLLKPYPQDRHRRGLFMLSTLDWLWPGADIEIRRVIDTS